MRKTQPQMHWYKAEMETVFQFITKTGFINMPLLSELLKFKSARSLRRFAGFMDQSRLFDPMLDALGFRGWCLSRSGKYEARGRGLRHSYPPRISARRHDEMALAVAIRLEQSGVVSDWSPEARFIVEPSNRLMVSQDNFGQKYPDLVLTLPNRNQNFMVAVELELNRKSVGRYEKALTGYKAVRGIDAIVFVVSSPLIRASIESALRRTRFDQNRLPVLFTDTLAFHKNPREACLTGAFWSGSFQEIGSIKGAVNAA